MNQMSGATGILINGCASLFSGSRRRRSLALFGLSPQLPATRSSSCSSSESTDSSLSSDVFDSICSADSSVDSSLSSAATTAVSSLDTLKSVDSSTFSRASSTHFYNFYSLSTFVFFTIGLTSLFI